MFQGTGSVTRRRNFGARLEIGMSHPTKSDDGSVIHSIWSDQMRSLHQTIRFSKNLAYARGLRKKRNNARMTETRTQKITPSA